MPRRRGALTSRIVALTVAITLALTFTACSSTYMLSSDAPKSGDLKRIVLLPINFDSSPPPLIAPGVEVMGERILLFLEARGYEVVLPRMSTTLALWKACTRDVGGISKQGGKGLDIDRYNEARSHLVRRTLESVSADAVVAVTVMVREGRYTGTKLRWDGVSREVPINTEATTHAVMMLRGEAAGTTLRTSVFDAKGRLIFQRYVGLEPVNAYKIVGNKYRPIIRKDLFQDEPLLEEAVALSFEPWMSPPSEP